MHVIVGRERLETALYKALTLGWVPNSRSDWPKLFVYSGKQGLEWLPIGCAW
jgi:hypothetical protein